MLEQLICTEQTQLVANAAFLIQLTKVPLNFLNGIFRVPKFSEALYSNVAILETKPPCLHAILSESFSDASKTTSNIWRAHNAKFIPGTTLSSRREHPCTEEVTRCVCRAAPSALLAHICTPPVAFSNTQNF
jgi:hypothetical protein